jgi:hypothetical protein
MPELGTPETERRNSDVLLGIDPSFPLTCENVLILRMETEKSVAAAADFADYADPAKRIVRSRGLGTRRVSVT